MNIVIMGAQGTGKGTVAGILKDSLSIPHISTGDMFRAAIKNQTKLGMTAKGYMEKGLLVPDEVNIGIVQERLLEDDCKGGFLLDGFPRTIAQAEALENFLKANGILLDAVLDVDVPVDILIQRMVGRRVCKGCGATYHVEFNAPKQEGVCDVCGTKLIQRADDTYETAHNRLDVYDKQTAPLLEFYAERNLLKTVDGNQSLEKVFEDIKAVLGA